MESRISLPSSLFPSCLSFNLMSSIKRECAVNANCIHTGFRMDLPLQSLMLSPCRSEGQAQAVYSTCPGTPAWPCWVPKAEGVSQVHNTHLPTGNGKRVENACSLAQCDIDPLLKTPCSGSVTPSSLELFLRRAG